MKTFTGLEAEKYILDPIHKSIPITSLELHIISTSTFQRLRKISQLGLDVGFALCNVGIISIAFTLRFSLDQQISKRA